MIDNNPFSGFINAWVGTSAAALQWSLARLGDLANFLGLGDKPATDKILPPYTPPFSGGQCIGDPYTIVVGAIYEGGGTQVNRYYARNLGSGTDVLEDAISFGNVQSPFIGAIPAPTYSENDSTLFADFGALGRINVSKSFFSFPTGFTIVSGSQFVAAVINRTNPSDSCGDLPNPNPPFGEGANAFESGNPDDGTEGELVAAGLPVLSVAGILAALRAIAEGIAAIGDVLNGIRQIGEAIKQISDLLKEIFDGKKDDDRAKPKYRRYAVGEWYRLPTVDGFIPATPITLDGVEAIPYKIQVVVSSFPSTSSRVLGVLSPSISIDSLPLFYLLLQEDDFGITAVKPIRTLNSSTSIPPFHRGIFWNFRLNPSINAKFRLFYQTEQIEEELPVLP